MSDKKAKVALTIRTDSTSYSHPKSAAHSHCKTASPLNSLSWLLGLVSDRTEDIHKQAAGEKALYEFRCIGTSGAGGG